MIDVQRGQLTAERFRQAPQQVEQNHRIDAAAQARDQPVAAPYMPLQDYSNVSEQRVTLRRLP